VLDTAGIKLGESYPAPIVDLAESRKEALARFDKIKQPAT
jgi:deoxyribodipyrimidine photo-lyase